MKEMKEEMPEGIKFHEVMDQAHVIKKITSSTTMNIIIGGILAIIFIFPQRQGQVILHFNSFKNA